MAFASETQLCNNALFELGAGSISSLVDGSVEANACNQMYAITRDALLRQHFWNFAIVRTSLAADVIAPDFEWSTAYTLPTDFIRVKKIFNDTSDYKIESGKLLCNIPDELQLVYVSKITDVTQFDQLFSEALVLALAIKIGRRVCGDGFDPRGFKQQLEQTLLQAKMVDAQDDSPDNFTWDSFLSSRWSSGNVWTSRNIDGTF